MSNYQSPFAIKLILVPVDFSEPSRQALDYAIAMAKPFAAEIRLLHVVEAVVLQPDVEVVETAVLAEQLNQEAARSLAKWREDIAAQATVTEDLRAGSPDREIIDAAAEANADLIVLGTHGRTGVARLLIGSTAERVVRHAPCPVLVVRERGRERETATLAD